MTNLLEHRIDDKKAREILDFLVKRAGCECFRMESFRHINDQLYVSFIIIPGMSEFDSYLKSNVNLHWNDGLTGLQTLFLPFSTELDMHVRFLSRMLEIAETSQLWFYSIGYAKAKTFLDKGETLESVLMSRDLSEGVI